MHSNLLPGAVVTWIAACLSAASAQTPRTGEPNASEPTPQPTSAPYQYTSLRGLPDAELFHFMEAGKSDSDFEQENRIKTLAPVDFWTVDAKAAALALVEANRTQEHRKTYQISFDNESNATPPVVATVALSYSSARCYVASDSHYFLRVDPQDSYLAYSESSSGGVVFCNFAYDQPAFDFRLCRLNYEDARKISDVIWWLDRIRCKDVSVSEAIEGAVTLFTSTITSSTADGNARLVLRSNGQPVVDRCASKWGWGPISERWLGDYDYETFVNFAYYLIGGILPDRLGKEWSQFEPLHRPDFESQDSVPAYTEREAGRLLNLSSQFLDWFTLDQECISLSIVTDAIRLIGTRAINSESERLRTIQATLPPAGPAKREYREVLAEQEKLRDPDTVRDRRKRKQLEQLRDRLEAELESIHCDSVTDSADHVRQATLLARRQIAEGNNPEQLSKRVLSGSDGGQWALQRLSQIDLKRYCDTLESIIDNTNNPVAARQLFDALLKADPTRAMTIARNVPADGKNALSISAYLLLRDAENVPNENERIATIIKILHDPKSGPDERGRAIDLLVPVDAPLRYPERDIDDALLKLFDSSQADDGIDSTRGKACRALAHRRRVDLFDRIAQQREVSDDTFSDILVALTELSQIDPETLQPRLLSIVARHLQKTNANLTDLMLLIWAADLRQLQPDLERLATHSADEYQDQRAHSSGGVAHPVTGRFHCARQVLAVWNETDPLTHSRLLLAMAIMSPGDFVRSDDPEIVFRLKTEMSRVADELSPTDREELLSFLSRVETDPPRSNGNPISVEKCREAAAFAREALRL